jgi:DNA repair protein RecO (recombination protein O)
VESVEGVVIRTQEYQEKGRIVTLFTRHQGVLSFVVKGMRPKQTALLALTTPLCRGEYLLKRRTSDLYTFCDGTLLDEHLALRGRLEWLRVAGLLTQAIFRSQMPHAPAPQLFALYRAYLAHIPHAPHLEALLCSFYLKLLRHEGLLEGELSMQQQLLVEARTFRALEGVGDLNGLAAALTNRWA